MDVYDGRDGESKGVWDLEKQEKVFLPLEKGGKLSSDLNHYVIIDNESESILWDLEEDSVSLSVENPDWLFSKEEDRYIVFSDKSKTFIRDLEAGKEISLPVKIKGRSQIFFSKDHKYVVTLTDGVNGGYQIWDLATEQEISLPEEFDLGGRPVFAEDSDYIATSNDSLSQLWQVGKNKSISLPIKEVNELTYSPDKRYMAIHGSEESILWDLERNKEVENFNHGRTYFVGFSPNGKYFIAHGEKSVNLWPLDEEKMVEDICERLTRNLTVQEWRQQVGEEEDYRKTCDELPYPDDHEPSKKNVLTPLKDFFSRYL